MEIKDVYRPYLVTCTPTATLRDVTRQMEDADAGLVVLMADGRLEGVISERDVVRAVARGADPTTTTAAEYATTEVVTVAADEDAATAARRMVDHGVRRLPVLSAAGDVMGMVSMRDLFAIETLLGQRRGGTHA